MSEDVRAGKMKLADFMEAEVVHVALGRPLHDHGHRLHHGLHGGGAGPGLAAERGHSGGRFAPLCAGASWPAGASWRWCTRTSGISQILTRKAFENAIRVNAAIGGSTNAVMHLLAMAGRVGVQLELDDFDRLGHDLPLLVDLMPSGRFLMEDFYYAGGMPAVVRELARTDPRAMR